MAEGRFSAFSCLGCWEKTDDPVPVPWPGLFSRRDVGIKRVTAEGSAEADITCGASATITEACVGEIPALGCGETVTVGDGRCCERTACGYGTW